MSEPRIAIVYDRINKFGGAEQVLLALKEAFPDSILVTSVYDPRGAKWLKNWDVRTTFLQHVPFARNHHEWFGWLMPLAFESLNLSDFDIVISVTSEAAKGVITNPSQLHICYCLTPTRYLWSHTTEYEGHRFQGLKRLFFSKLREWDFIAAKRPDIMIPISKHVRSRIEKYYRRKTEKVIYPPVKIEVRNQRSEAREERSKNLTTDPLPLSSYYLVVSRLVPYKKIDLAIQACLQSDHNLVIVGIGSDEERLKSISNGNSNIQFKGFITQAELEELYSQAKALLCPQEEDFGIVSVEAQSFGIPVISYQHSGVAETVTPNVSGLLFSKQTVSSLCEAMEALEQTNWDRKRIADSAQSYGKDRFIKEFKKALDDWSLRSTATLE